MKSVLLTIVAVFLFLQNHLNAQIVTTGLVTKTEIFEFQLFPDNGSEVLSIPFNVQSEGTLTGIVTCKTDGFILASDDHLNFILFQKDTRNELISVGGKSFKDQATISYVVTGEELAKGKDFVFTTRLLQSKAKCQCKLEVKYVGSVILDDMDSSEN